MSRASTAVLASLLLLLPAVALLPSAEAGTTRKLTITTGSAQPRVPFQAFDVPLKLFDIDGDGDREIIAHNDNRWVYVFDGRTGALLAELTTTYPAGWGARPLNAVEAAVMERGGAAHLVVANSAAYVTDFRFDGVGDGGKFRFTKAWERRLTDCHGNPAMDAKPVLADLDRDGDFEVLAQTEEVGVYALKHTGATMWKRCIGGGNGEPGIGDVDADGWPDVVWASDGGVVTASDGRTGNTRWTFWTGNPQYGLGSASMPVGPSVVQLDGTGGADVLVGARDNSDCENFDNNHATLFAISGGGRLLWRQQDPAANPLAHTHPMVHDVDGDGRRDVLWADWNTQGHKCGAWDVTGPANFYRFDQQGNLKWRVELGTFWNNKDLALADVDGDGVQEVLANGPSGGNDGIWYLNSRTGAKEAFVSTWPWKVTRGPVVADLYGDGTMQWVVPVYAFGSGSSGGAIQVYDTGQRFNSAWPHLPTPELGSGGGDVGGGAGGGGGGAFSGTFTVPTSVNNWWVEVSVKASEPVSKVEARVDGGAWVALAKQSWGAWAKSFFVPTGASVVFRATSSDGDAMVSGTYKWRQTFGTTTGTAGAGGAPFSATFQPTSTTNNWWVEVKVGANEPVSAVHARVDSGAWTALQKQSWGTWAKSFFVRDGAKVQFRATSADGDTAFSGTYTWS